MKTILLLLWIIFSINATAQTYRPAHHAPTSAQNPNATIQTEGYISGRIAAVLTNSNAVLFQKYTNGDTNKPPMLVMLRNVTNGVFGERRFLWATQRGSTNYQGYQLQLWDAPIYHPQPTDISGDIAAVLTNAVVVQEFTRSPSSYGQNEYGQRIVTSYTKTPIAKVVVQNVDATNAAEGDFVRYQAMRDGVTNYEGHTLQLWTCQK